MENDNVLFVKHGKRGGDAESSNNDDMWDDTALIEAYDDAVTIAKNIVENRMYGASDSMNASSSESNSSVQPTVKGSSKRRQPKKDAYSVGDPCRCLYSEDGIIYEASVISVSKTGSCVVRYVGYENEEVVDASILRPSCGQAARDEQQREARLVNTDVNPHGDEYESEHRASKRNTSRSSKSPRHKMDWEGPDVGRPRPESRGDSEFARHAFMPMPQMTVPPPPPLNMLPAVSLPMDESDALSAMLMSWYMSGFHTGYYQGVKLGSEQARAQSHRTPTRKK